MIERELIAHIGATLSLADDNGDIPLDTILHCVRDEADVVTIIATIVESGFATYDNRTVSLTIKGMEAAQRFENHYKQGE